MTNFKHKSWLSIVLFIVVCLYRIDRIFCVDIDPNGYILYCPCMGRFGNQAEQFLGTLQFAKHFNRTLVLPPFIQYINDDVHFLPFEDVINVTRLEEYHRVLPMSNFLSEVAPNVWPEKERSIFCYSARKLDSTSAVDSCNAHEGSPFRPFWRHLNIESFPKGSVFYAPLHTDYHFIEDWSNKYPPSMYKVIAFVGAPSPFPTNNKAVQLQRFVHFSEKLKQKAMDYALARGLYRKSYLSVHIRHGQDWLKACKLLEKNTDLKTLFSSQQCLGSFPERRVTYDLCHPSLDDIATWIESTIKNNPGEKIEVLHIASDFENITMWKELHERLDHSLTIVSATHTIDVNGDVSRFYGPTGSGSFTNDDLPLVDLYLMSHANLFIGNCVSSFTAFASRYRNYNHHLVERTFFFGFQDDVRVKHFRHDEL